MRQRHAIISVCLATVAMPVVGWTMYYTLLGCGGRQQQPTTNFTQDVAIGTLATPDTLVIAEDRSFQLRPGGTFPTPFTLECPTEPGTGNYGEAEARGARRVRVAFPGLSEPLYGVLAFCRIESSFRGSASRSYRVEVPQSYVDATEGGRVSVVFERYDVNGRTLPAWVLWLSREPMPQQAVQAPPRRSGC